MAFWDFLKKKEEGEEPLESPEVTEEDISKLSKYFKEVGIKADPKDFKKIVPLTDKPFYKGRDSKCQ